MCKRLYTLYGEAHAGSVFESFIHGWRIAETSDDDVVFLLVAVRFKINEKLLNFINFIEIKTKWLAKHDKRVAAIHR